MTAATAEARRVRVTLEGVARPVKHDPRYITVRTIDQTLLIRTDTLGAVVEDIAPERVWTAGDVVQAICDDRVWRRIFTEGGPRWSNGFMSFRTDANMSALVASGAGRVLRYQHGEA